jgi:hypothetical protein
MRSFLILLFLVSIIAVPGVTVQPAFSQPRSPAKATNFVGRWRVKFTLAGGTKKNLILESLANGLGAFRLLDTAPDDKPVAAAQPAIWSQLSNDRVSFSGEVELPMGTCCREMGTLMFKGKFLSSNSISGKLVFVTSVDEEESPYKLRSLVGTFDATRIPNK